MKIIYKLILAILVVLVAIFTNYEMKSFAVEQGDSVYLSRAEKGFYSIQCWNGSEWIYVTYSRTYYTDNDGVQRIAYCLNPELKGIGWISGEFDGYNVKLENLLSDEKMWRVIINGYPYKTYQHMGVETEDDAYIATKMAVYAMMRNYSVNDIKSLYRAGEDKVAGENIEDIQRRGNKVIQAICNLVDIGYNGNESIQYNDLFSIKKIGNLKKCDYDDNYCEQTCKINSKIEASEIVIESLTDFPEGTKITNEAYEEKTTFKGGDEFKILVPKAVLTKNINGKLNFIGSCENYPIYYAKCEIGNYQNYAICTDSYSKNIKFSTNINMDISKSSLKIEKIDKDSKVPLENIKFLVKYKDGEEIGTYKTDENGCIHLNDLHQGIIVVKELETNSNYILNDADLNIPLGYDETKAITIENEIKKGAIKIIKVDADNNECRIEGVKFEIYNENKELINSIITNKNGEAQIDNLPINSKYIIKEVETADEYILSEDCLTISLEESETKTVTLKNRKKSKEVLPRTGELDVSKYMLIIPAVGNIVEKKFFVDKKRIKCKK